MSVSTVMLIDASDVLCCVWYLLPVPGDMRDAVSCYDDADAVMQLL
jgi:hypothetical protein